VGAPPPRPPANSSASSTDPSSGSTATPGPRRAKRGPGARGVPTAIVVAVAVLLLFLALTLTGIISPFPAAPGPVSFGHAAIAARALSNSTPDGPWSLVLASGLSLAAPYPPTNWTNNWNDDCNVTAGSETVPSFGLDEPPFGDRSAYLGGELPQWFFLYASPGDARELMVEVTGAGASEIGVAASGLPAACWPGELPPLGGPIVDTPEVASEFLASATTQTFLVQYVPATVFFDVAPVEFNPEGTLAPAWLVGYSTCPAAYASSPAAVGAQVFGLYNATSGAQIGNITLTTPPFSGCGLGSTPDHVPVYDFPY
jgi:hypothetical protein